ncbi:MAG TPA: response regulator transcription factor [Solirubrobacteraceae bacterium]
MLVVDDQESFREVLRDLVAATKGFTLVGDAASGEAALEAVAELSPNMVILDKRMPGMGGIEAARVLTARHPHVVVVLASVEEMDPELLGSCRRAAIVRKQQLTTTKLRELWRDHGI